MPYLVSFVKYPSHIASKVAKKYLEFLQKFPPDNSLGENIIPSAVKVTDEGIRILSVTRVNKGKFDEIWKLAIEQRAFFMDVEGYESSIEVWATVEEALASLGMKLP
ncbi:MAG: hypothetical protein KGD65_12760 [Candidatus Lokiarchaeota archaeon]|nr:hypothetical protein [Candidatus Lokiarchaeota archaeon]